MFRPIGPTFEELDMSQNVWVHDMGLPDDIEEGRFRLRVKLVEQAMSILGVHLFEMTSIPEDEWPPDPRYDVDPEELTYEGHVNGPGFLLQILEQLPDTSDGVPLSKI